MFFKYFSKSMISILYHTYNNRTSVYLKVCFVKEKKNNYILNYFKIYLYLIQVVSEKEVQCIAKNAAL